MMSLRSIVRSAPRALTRASASTVVCRSQAAIRTSSLSAFRTQSAALRPQQASAFSTSIFRSAAANANETDEELSLKLASEIEFEQDVKENEPIPTSVKDYMENGPFKIHDTPGKEEVVLTRTYGNETITVSFSIADLHNYEQNDMYDEDPALSDEDAEGEGRSQERDGEPAEGEEDLEGLTNEPEVPCRLNIVVEKPGQGALTIEAVAQEGAIVMENMFYYKDAKLAHGANAETSHAAQDVYPGPPFGSLDEDLQILMERYLEDRGITQALAVFVPEYMDMKEQKEYLSWLTNVKKFIDA
ncbi:mitochondrial glycoprotein [Podospora appendiculata]|uniref:Mitochondrial glycoprotein n=1 Tax=Podospora appendiculata TaxID=314037 RepID=A0AAE1CDP1_9PEZI|nr:mitochondrial glycoprotein [Podospora appendiculata]